ncbi:oxysterol-binding protein-related protein 1-like [Dendronephthya gigantea]|uniref:oxysterol-binding protein-related protein 1-like n=1 Tax=Dendronephthya gigantea TaxID=151771 RepID=UPI0010694235|nr:oxysterol-binding protein-related protein 1-like [Dendronephthya gigantea]
MSEKRDERGEKLITAARKGDIQGVKDLIKAEEGSSSEFNINYKGKTKLSFGWTALHTSIQHENHEIMDALIKAGADVNIKTDGGETALHKAAMVGRKDFIVTLLENGANPLIVNCDEKTSSHLAKEDAVKDILQEAENQEQEKIQKQFLTAAREGNTKVLKGLIFGEYPPNINCSDDQGNTALHLASYRGKKEVAVMLLQNGANPSCKNNNGQTALNLTDDLKMKKLLDVQPSQISRSNSFRKSTKSFKVWQRMVPKFEGYLLKKSRFFGWKKYWVVLDKGIVSWFRKRADAVSGVKRQGLRNLENSVFAVSKRDEHKIKMQFSDNSILLWSVKCGGNEVSRQCWLNSLHEHQAYSTYFINQPSVDFDDELEDNILPVETMENALKGAQAHQNILKKQVSLVEELLNGLSEDLKRSKNTFLSIKDKLTQVLASAKEMYSSLNHCLSLVSQQEEARRLQLDDEAERRRVLEDALHVLAAEHHVLSSSLSRFPESPGKMSSWETSEAEEYYSPQEELDFLSASDQEENDDYDIQSPVVNGNNGVLPGPEAPNNSGVPMVLPEASQPNDLMSELPEGRHRTSLPLPMLSRDFSVWAVLKHCIGKDLSRITMPVIFNEPITFLQRICEYMEYGHMLKTAQLKDDPFVRMQYVAAFAVSSTASNLHRVGKPFNPLLGETYELVREDLGYRIVTEQVSHHPPISALHCEGKGFKFHCSVQPKLRFWGKGVEIVPKGIVSLEFTELQESYTWNNINACVHNIIIGQLWIEQYGQMEIINHTHGVKCIVNFKPCGWFGREINKVEGAIYNKKGGKEYILQGDWTKHLYGYSAKPKSKAEDEFMATQSMGSTTGSALIAPSISSTSADSTDEEDDFDRVLLWTVNPRPPNSKEMYNFTSFAMQLNELHEEQAEKLAPTDSRLRPDVRTLETLDIDYAADEKRRLEEKQRTARKERSKRKEEHVPRWFKEAPNPHNGQTDWIFCEQYWERDFSKCPDIF